VRGCVSKQFEQWMATGLGDVFGGRFVDAESDTPKNSDWWPEGWADQCPQWA
jgi:hypothetical protein